MSKLFHKYLSIVYRHILIIFLFFVCFFESNAQQHFSILSPRPSDTITSGKLLIAIRTPESTQKTYSKLLLVLDAERNLSSSMQVRPKMISAIYPGKLSGGKHYFELLGVDKLSQDTIILVYHEFIVRKVKIELPEIAPDSLKPQPRTLPKTKVPQPAKPFITGRIYFNTVDADISGPGAALRQQPSEVREVGGDIRLRLGKETEMPIKGFYTTNAQGQFGFRNHFNAGIIHKGSSLTFGDHFVNQDRLTFNGIRVRGVYLDAFIPNSNKKVKFKFMYGRNVDANSLPNTFPQHPDSANNIFSSAVPRYRRDYHLVQIYVQHNKQAYGQFSIVRVRDYAEGEIIAGINPMDNVAIAWEKYIPVAKNRGYVRLNAAMAYTSFNNTLGGEAAFNFLIHLNASTVPYSWKGAPQCAFQLQSSIPIAKNNDLILEGRRVGASFYSLANPYMLNNRQGFRIADRLRLFKGKFFLTLSYDYLIDNLGNQRPQTRENSSISGSASIRISPKWPSITIGYRQFLGNTYSILSENFQVENTNLFGSLNYTLRINPITLQFSLARNDMNLISEMMANNRQQSNSLTISATYRNVLGASIRGMQTTHFLTDSERPQQMFSARLWYRIKKPNIRFSVTGMTNTMEFEDLGTESRQGVQGSIDFGWKRYFNIGISGGYLPFDSYDVNRTYTERFVRIRGSIRF